MAADEKQDEGPTEKPKRSTRKESSTKKAAEEQSETRPVCGLVMPISATSECSEKHWRDVKAILTDALDPKEAMRVAVAV